MDKIYRERYEIYEKAHLRGWEEPPPCCQPECVKISSSWYSEGSKIVLKRGGHDFPRQSTGTWWTGNASDLYFFLWSNTVKIDEIKLWMQYLEYFLNNVFSTRNVLV